MRMLLSLSRILFRLIELWLITIKSITNDTEFEFHLIAGEGTSLIAENVLYLSQFFVYWGGWNLSPFITRFHIHIAVLLYEVSLK